MGINFDMEIVESNNKLYLVQETFLRQNIEMF